MFSSPVILPLCSEYSIARMLGTNAAISPVRLKDDSALLIEEHKNFHCQRLHAERCTVLVHYLGARDALVYYQQVSTVESRRVDDDG